LKLLNIARRLLFASAPLLLGAIAVSVLTRDAWLILAHTAGIGGAAAATIGVLLLLVAGVRRLTPGSSALAPPSQAGSRKPDLTLAERPGGSNG
jgi:hypothetical protein